jgi:hypothetical protein
MHDGVLHRGCIYGPGLYCNRCVSGVAANCVHISGLELEGRHPRALMESALLPLQQVIGLEGPAPDKVRKKPVYRCAINDIVCNLRKPFL